MLGGCFGDLKRSRKNDILLTKNIFIRQPTALLRSLAVFEVSVSGVALDRMRMDELWLLCFARNDVTIQRNDKWFRRSFRGALVGVLLIE
jgi:hypothetical protein